MAALISKLQSRTKYKLFFCAVAFNITTLCNAQNFSQKANLDSVVQNDYYSIAITPELSSYVKTDFSDLRVADNKQQYQPYIISALNKFTHSHNYTTLKLLKNEVADSGRSILIIENPQVNLITSLVLKIRNAAVSRNATISGSDDNKKWFTIKEDISFEKEFADDKDHFTQTLNFPASTYHYYKLLIENSGNDPLNIIEAGYATSSEYKSIDNYIANPPVVFTQKDSSDDYSYLFIDQQQPYHTAKITIIVSGPPFFKRDIDLVKQNGARSGFQISSDSIFNFYVPVFNDKQFLLRIYNGDNPPLHVRNIYTEQESKNIITYLEAGKQYRLLMHDSSATLPSYDLQLFRDSIISNTLPLNFTSIEKVSMQSEAKDLSWSKKLLWPIIIIAITILSILTFRLTKELEKKTNT